MNNYLEETLKYINEYASDIGYKSFRLEPFQPLAISTTENSTYLSSSLFKSFNTFENNYRIN